jgi:hypothetical protein
MADLEAEVVPVRLQAPAASAVALRLPGQVKDLLVACAKAGRPASFRLHLDANKQVRLVDFPGEGAASGENRPPPDDVRPA